MFLSQIIDNSSAYLIGEDKDISVCYSYSKQRVDGGLFFCLDGERLSGGDFVDEAEKFGAVAVVTDRILQTKLTQVIVPDAREAYSIMTARFYGDPQNRLKVIGVVGTNGKTSTCGIVCAIFSAAGRRIGNIGTEGSFFDDLTIPAELTTPDPERLYPILKQMADGGAEYVVMEVSAHAIQLKKVAPIKFDTLVFTNCTEDHLDYFSDMERYKAVKKSIFESAKNCKVIVNGDDDTGRELSDEIFGAVTYGIFEPADVFATLIRESKTKTSYVLNIFDDLYEIKTGLLGTFNVYNQLAALTCAYMNGIDIAVAVRTLKTIPAVAGRMERVATINGGDVFIDYAHTPDGLEKSLLYLRKVIKGNLIVVFGCGGNRDKNKRPLMGKTAGDIADFVIITSDNPRFEDACKIISEAEAGVREATMDYITIKDRKAAIEYGVKILKEGDALLVAGKGAENYQEIMGVKHAFSDKQVVLSLVGENV